MANACGGSHRRKGFFRVQAEPFEPMSFMILACGAGTIFWRQARLLDQHGHKNAA
jgi:hypothetical protein